MLVFLLNHFIAFSLFNALVQACVPLLIDDYSQNRNLVKGRRGDKGTMNKFDVEFGLNDLHSLTINPKDENSLFFETGICESGNFNTLFSGLI